MLWGGDCCEWWIFHIYLVYHRVQIKTIGGSTNQFMGVCLYWFPNWEIQWFHWDRFNQPKIGTWNVKKRPNGETTRSQDHSKPRSSKITISPTKFGFEWAIHGHRMDPHWTALIFSASFSLIGGHLAKPHDVWRVHEETADSTNRNCWTKVWIQPVSQENSLDAKKHRNSETAKQLCSFTNETTTTVGKIFFSAIQVEQIIQCRRTTWTG